MLFFFEENRILLLTDGLDIPSRMELHENIRKYVDIDFVDTCMVNSPFLMLDIIQIW